MSDFNFIRCALIRCLRRISKPPVARAKERRKVFALLRVNKQQAGAVWDDNGFHPQRGNLLQHVLRPQFDQNFWPLITLMSAVVVHEALLAACALQTDIKWPNDILHDEKKLCGILAEIVETPTGTSSNRRHRRSTY